MCLVNVLQKQTDISNISSKPNPYLHSKMACNAIAIPLGVVGLFIGPRGSSIKEMMKETGAKILVGRKPLRGGRFKLVSVQGTRSERDRGMKAVKKWLASEKVQKILNKHSQEKATRYGNQCKLIVVEEGDWKTVVKGKGSADERIKKQFWGQIQDECSVKLNLRNKRAVKDLNKRTGFNWADAVFAEDALEEETKKAIKGRFSIKR